MRPNIHYTRPDPSRPFTCLWTLNLVSVNPNATGMSAKQTRHDNGILRKELKAVTPLLPAAAPRSVAVVW